MTPLDPLLSSDGLRAVDQATMSDWGVPGRVLMETAGRAATQEIAARYAVADRRVTVLAGTGNNGGDALVVARELARLGAIVHTVAPPASSHSGDRAANLALLSRLADGSDRISFSETPPPADLVVDGVLGIGATGDLRAPARELCAWANRQRAPVVALDVPSGLDATTGAAPDDAVEADLTVTFGAIKTGLVLREGPRLAGELVTVDIGFPERVVASHARAWRTTTAWVAARLPRRAHDAHKYSAGTAACVVGSRRYTGAAVLSTAAAYRAGAGAVVACTTRSARATIDAANPEVMVRTYADTDRGTIGLDARDRIGAHLRDADAALIGCGLGSAEETRTLARDLTLHTPTPVVLDADGLGAFAGRANDLAERAGPLVMTPHLGEYRRLIGDSSFQPDDLVETVREAAARWDAVVVLKGMPSVVGAPDGRVIVGPPGRPALATAGSGDVLAGTTVGLLAQGLDAVDAAACALALGAAAVDALIKDRQLARGGAGLVASDIAGALPSAFARFA